ncbi:MAG TPA: BrnT family toxin [Candidatus Eremiobacteraceae bacterium]|nr:BrnT family toxin [Candidatus Eremiobacteraceae bacterium]
MRFEWDPHKAVINLRKHGVSFETAIRIFEDPRVLSAQDTRYSDERWYSIGNVGKRIIYVAHTIENEGQTNETIRIISARKASARERREYQADAATDLGADDGKSSG